jgi:hypothetical protein
VALGICGPRPAAAEDSPPHPVASRQQIEQAVDRAIGYLQTESASWMKTRNCAACHHAAMPLWALGEARRQGYAIDEKFVSDTFAATLGSPEKLIAAKLFDDPAAPPDPRPIGQGVKIGAAFLAVAAQSLPALDAGQKHSLRRIGEEIVKKQREDGSWDFYLSRPPINESQTTDAAWLIMALQGAADADAPESPRAALAKATAWLAAKELPDNLQDKVLRLLLAARTGKSGEETKALIDDLFAL